MTVQEKVEASNLLAVNMILFPEQPPTSGDKAADSSLSVTLAKPVH